MSDWRFSKKTRAKLSAPRKKSRHNLKNLHSKITKTLENNDIQILDHSNNSNENNDENIDLSDSRNTNDATMTHTINNNIFQSTYRLVVSDRHKINAEEYILQGRRMVDIAFLFKAIQSIRHNTFDCTFSDLKIIKEKKNGFFSTFVFKCKICGTIENIYSEDPERKGFSINTAVTSAILNTGQGYSQLEEFCGILDMYCMSLPTYQNIHEQVSQSIFSVSLDEMIKAGQEESKIAIENGDVDEQGRPLITVIADGAWSKRSYKSNYNALSGVASIFGWNTKKCLFVGVKNKYCIICHRASQQNEPTRSHVCYKNWDSTSTSMESSIIVEGFKESIPMHNLIYDKLIGDGDSSVMKNLSLTKPYGPDLNIKKIECTNHLLRNYINRLRETASRRKCTNGNIVPGVQRTFLKNNVLRLRYAVTEAIKFRSNMKINATEKVKLLKSDILNGPYHVFGYHTHCDQYFCDSLKDGENNLVPDLEKSGLWNDILAARNLLAHHSSSLIHNVNNNCVENYNSVVAKYVGGKRINFSLKGSYQTRCHIALTSLNAGPSHISVLHKKITKASPGVFTKRFIEQRSNKNKNKLKRRQLFGNSKSTKKVYNGPDRDYGCIQEEPQILDMDPKEFNIKKIKFLERVSKTNEEIKTLEESTKNQSESELWKVERSIRLTASNFGKVCKLRLTTSRKNTVKSILYNTFSGNLSTNYGIENEPIARISFEKVINLKIKPAGLFVDKTYHFLAASPDGLIEDDGIIEIKCPYTIKDLTPEDAIQNGKLKFATVIDGKLNLKTNDNYYYQIQGQLHITQRAYCYFVVWSSKGMLYQKIVRDDVFFELRMQQQLISFYHDHLLHEILDSRFNRGLPIRD
ncbi:uncharacterized protein LOC132935681 [Metopolophium dirhodum]|uniref:uncharacterized protein LOC132935681 n=2 Tax=Metopolophium dirhodum TaxID=44670 RepID=UPI0029900050|nr:uncharacterized protein LOC132935681 [Metopolophium dirhodum]